MSSDNRVLLNAIYKIYRICRILFVVILQNILQIPIREISNKIILQFKFYNLTGVV